jgi:2-oxoisovalerate dehydrogenase E1 component
VTGKWAPPVVSQVLEAAALADASDVERMIRELLSDSGLPLPGEALHA